MTARLDSLHHSVAIFGAALLTVILVAFSTPIVPFA